MHPFSDFISFLKFFVPHRNVGDIQNDLKFEI